MTGTAAAATRYTTIAGQHRHELEIRRSRFITVLQRVETEDEVRDLLGKLRREFSDARHHCSAFVLGPRREIQRANDDGEPSGTAGQPMLEALTRRESSPGRADLSDIAAIVVRYFGGTLLGAGGLVRAYSDSVSQALDSAPVIIRERRRVLEILAPPATAGRLENELRALGTPVLAVEYETELVRLTVAVDDQPAVVEAFSGRIAGLTAGTLTALPIGREWVDRA
ncbi:IMPACT family protein [Arthrobacter subterraneus]|uniref:IMPACT family protein n=1 Tax=Arthrobacter subterraneus TaxID=335973 RepID=UPI003800A5E5